MFTNSTAYAINNLMRINSVIGRKGSVSIPFGCMPMPQSYLIPFEGYFLDLSGAGASEWAVATSRRYLLASCWALIA